MAWIRILLVEEMRSGCCVNKVAYFVKDTGFYEIYENIGELLKQYAELPSNEVLADLDW